MHRPRYDDWSFPKGKLEADESFTDGALREVAEETGLIGVLGLPLPDSRYTDHRGRAKVVRWWLLEVTGHPEPGGAVPNDEVDELRWVTPREAARLVTHPVDAALARRAEELLGL